MRVNWVVSADMILDPVISPNDLKIVGPIWGSWRSWRGCDTDNVICHDIGEARRLLARAFQAVCNLYLPRKYYQDLQRPLGAKWYDGDFQQQVKDIEDIVAMHLAASNSDLVLLLGFDLSPIVAEDAMQHHRAVSRLALIRQIVIDTIDVQWVLINHEKNLDLSISHAPNFTCDLLPNVLELLT